MKGEISFPARKIKIVNADIEIEIEISQTEYDCMLDVFNRHEMEPIIRLVLRSPLGDTAHFTNLKLIKEEGIFA